ncbi:MAG TPA: type II toxin-antitoxin system Phd/YefM family antitoxin [Caulobacteraceae bacterium]|jgi:prevent-host-death family protein
MPDAQSFTATEFKAKCLDILDRVAAHKFTRVTITKRGKIVAVLTPPEDAETTVRQLHGFMRGSVVAPSDFDFTAPVLDEPLSAEGGELHK